MWRSTLWKTRTAERKFHGVTPNARARLFPRESKQNCMVDATLCTHAAQSRHVEITLHDHFFFVAVPPSRLRTAPHRGVPSKFFRRPRPTALDREAFCTFRAHCWSINKFRDYDSLCTRSTNRRRGEDSGVREIAALSRGEYTELYGFRDYSDNIVHGFFVSYTRGFISSVDRCREVMLYTKVHNT